MSDQSHQQFNKDSTAIHKADANVDDQTGPSSWNWAAALTLVPIIAILLATYVAIAVVPIPSLETLINPTLIIAGLVAILMVVTLVAPSNYVNIARVICLVAIIAVVIMWMRGQLA